MWLRQSTGFDIADESSKCQTRQLNSLLQRAEVHDAQQSQLLSKQHQFHGSTM
jgi:hypothetical protein